MIMRRCIISGRQCGGLRTQSVTGCYQYLSENHQTPALISIWGKCPINSITSLDSLFFVSNLLGRKPKCPIQSQFRHIRQSPRGKLPYTLFYSLKYQRNETPCDVISQKSRFNCFQVGRQFLVSLLLKMKHQSELMTRYKLEAYILCLHSDFGIKLKAFTG